MCLAICPIPPVYILNPPFSGRQLLITLIAEQKGENFKTSFCCHSINLRGARRLGDLWCYFFSIYYTREMDGFRINTQGETDTFLYRTPAQLSKMGIFEYIFRVTSFEINIFSKMHAYDRRARASCAYTGNEIQRKHECITRCPYYYH